MMRTTRTPEPDASPAPSGEREWLAASLMQAKRDLSASTRADIRESAAAFWRGEDGVLGWFCAALDLDVPRVQTRIVRQCPDVAAPHRAP